MGKLNKRIVRVNDTTWMAYCQLCGKRISKRYFDSGQACNEYLSEHTKTEGHKFHFTAKAGARRADRMAEDALLRAIFKETP